MAVLRHRERRLDERSKDGFELTRPARLRGGFVNRNYVVTYPDRRLRIITYAEPGANGRYEQFLVQPVS